MLESFKKEIYIALHEKNHFGDSWGGNVWIQDPKTILTRFREERLINISWENMKYKLVNPFLNVQISTLQSTVLNSSHLCAELCINQMA